MEFDERGALDITAVRALEMVDRAHALWTDDDRAWASRAAAEVVGAGATSQAFLTQRARLALERMGGRFKVLPRAVLALRWRTWVGTGIVIAALLAGVAVDRIGGTARINVLAPPVLGLLAWNVMVYAFFAARFVVRYGDPAPAGALRRFIARISGGLLRPRGRAELGSAVLQLASEWSRISAPLHQARAARILHLAGAALAVGLVAGLYLRGIALEYRASWESTFLDAEAVHSVLTIVLAPGAALTGISVPAIADVAAIRAPGDQNAARWLHLMAATLALVVIVPRLLFALYAGLIERHRAARVRLPLDEPYFQRLLRGFRGGAARVHAVPYSYSLTAPATLGIERLVARVYGGGAALTMHAPVTYGAEDGLAFGTGHEQTSSVIAVFNATATPEREAHGAFLTALASQLAPACTLVALVDESAFRTRFAHDPALLVQRQRIWRELCADRRVPCVFANLAAPDVAEAESALERALAEAIS